MFKRKHIYFVYYTYKSKEHYGDGMAKICPKKKVNTYSDILTLAERIKAINPGMKNMEVMVVNYKKIKS